MCTICCAIRTTLKINIKNVCVKKYVIRWFTPCDDFLHFFLYDIKIFIYYFKFLTLIPNILF